MSLKRKFGRAHKTLWRGPRGGVDRTCSERDNTEVFFRNLANPALKISEPKLLILNELQTRHHALRRAWRVPDLDLRETDAILCAIEGLSMRDALSLFVSQPP